MGMYQKGLLLVVDGLVYPIFNKLLNQGKLDNIAKHVYERSIVQPERAISSHPSSTFENMQAINTGRFPFDPGATSYSKDTETIADMLRLDNTSKGYCGKRDTIFKFVPDRSISIHNPWNDHAEDKHPHIYSLASLHYLRGWNGSNDAAVGRYLVSLNNRMPTFSEIWLPAYDRFAHLESDQKLAERYIELDKQVGKIVKGLQNKGLYDETLLVFISDHSMEKVEVNTNPNKICSDAGLKPKIGRNTQDFDCRVFAYGYSVGQVYLSDNFNIDRLDNIVNGLLDSSAVEHVIINSKQNEKIVHSKKATVRLSKENGKYKMEVIKGQNPFDYDDKLCSELCIPHSAIKSLELTANQDQPDAVVGILESMTHPDSPDIRFLASPRYDFGKIRNATHFPAFMNANRIRTHGNSHIAQSQVPLVIAGSNAIKQDIKIARNIDWLPTYLHLLGYGLPPNLDGKSLI